MNCCVGQGEKRVWFRESRKQYVYVTFLLSIWLRCCRFCGIAVHLAFSRESVMFFVCVTGGGDVCVRGDG